MTVYSEAFGSIKHLTMGKMTYDWFMVTKCMLAFSSIKELVVSFNNICTIEEIEDASNIMKLVELSLENNLIHDWKEVLKLGKLPW